jgi:uncharacterized protein
MTIIMNKEDIFQPISEGYASKGENILLGGAMLDGKMYSGRRGKDPLKTMNRHGLIAGATGTGKTKTYRSLPNNFQKRGFRFC